ncbi:MAG: hypothetical protein FVQ85_10630 [Planctomycetes bacterium]|nr:hypothetical protein [Planctomycetota bacterium]
MCGMRNSSLLGKITIVIVLLSFLLAVIPCQAEIIYVDDNGSADFNSIQDAIDWSWDGDIIEVQPGTYYERINFYGLDIIVTSTNPNDVNSAYATVIDANGIGNVITFDSLEDNSSVLKGFTIQNGQNGIYCFYSDPLITNCIIRNNGDCGIAGHLAQPTITDTHIMANIGSGVYDCDGQISGCVISDNNSYGLVECDGPITNSVIRSNSDIGLYKCNGDIKHSNISGNSACGLSQCDGLIANCIIYGNSQAGLNQCRGSIKNCTVGWNKGDGFYLDDGAASTYVSSNIIVKNGGYGVTQLNGYISLRYNDIWGNFNGSYYGVPPGSSDIHRNPVFALDGYWDINDVWVEGDYHLKSEAGRWDPKDQKWVIDDVTSFCVDAGDPGDASGDEPYPNGDIINQGVYGGTEHASKSPYQVIYCTAEIPGDLDGDCKVDFNDFVIIASDWLEGQIQEEFNSGATMDVRSGDMSGNIFVFHAYRSGDYNIYGYDLSTYTEFPIGKPGRQDYPAIDNNIVVWYDWRNGNSAIYGYDLSTGKEFAICTAAGSRSHPAVDGNIIVWGDYRGPDWDIYGADISDPCEPNEFPICTAFGQQQEPAISGNIVVWQDSRNEYYHIYGYDLSTNTEFPICTVGGNKGYLAVSGDIVTWIDDRSGDYEVYGYIISSQTEFLIASGSVGHPDLSGNIVVWHDYSSGEGNIYGYDVSAEIEFPICITEGNQGDPFISGDTVAWRDYSDYFLYWRELCDVYFAGDIKPDCKVDFSDFLNISTNWLDCNLHPPEACWE